MKLILIDGGPAAGKNTLGELLVTKLLSLGRKVALLDLDTYAEQLNPKWIWETNKQKEKDVQEARINFAKSIDDYLQQDFDIIAIGDRFMTNEQIQNLTSNIHTSCQVLLYHLSVPFEIREQRLHTRGPHSLIDLQKDQTDRDAIKEWPGYVYENINSPKEDAENLLLLIEQNKGLIKQHE